MKKINVFIPFQDMAPALNSAYTNIFELMGDAVSAARIMLFI